MSGRLRPFTFALSRGAESREATFYAIDAAEALKLARAWAARRGWTTELVVEEDTS